jgi:hypothetical protein
MFTPLLYRNRYRKVSKEIEERERRGRGNNNKK